MRGKLHGCPSKDGDRTKAGEDAQNTEAYLCPIHPAIMALGAFDACHDPPKSTGAYLFPLLRQVCSWQVGPPGHDCDARLGCHPLVGFHVCPPFPVGKPWCPADLGGTSAP
jgi:hypothetical protein